MMASKPYLTMNRGFALNPEQEDFLTRRVMPFLDGIGLQTRSPLVLLSEAYLQGIADAVEVMRGKHD